MAMRKRPERPARRAAKARKRAAAARQPEQPVGAPAGGPQEGREETKAMAARLADVEALSFAQVATLTGIDKYRLGEVVRRAGVPVYRSPVDARKKYLKREDVGRLTGLTPEVPPPPAGADSGAAE